MLERLSAFLLRRAIARVERSGRVVRQARDDEALNADLVSLNADLVKYSDSSDRLANDLIRCLQARRRLTRRLVRRYKHDYQGRRAVWRDTMKEVELT